MRPDNSVDCKLSYSHTLMEKEVEAWKLCLNQQGVQRVYQTKLLQKGKKKKKKKKKQLSKEPTALKRPFRESQRHKEKGGLPISPRPCRHPHSALCGSRSFHPFISHSCLVVLFFLFLLIAASPGRCRRSFLQLPVSSETLLDNERGGKKKRKQRRICTKKRSVRVWFPVQRWCADVEGICSDTDVIAKELFAAREGLYLSIYLSRKGSILPSY